MALIEVAEGRGSEALGDARKGLELDSNNPRTIGEAGYVLAQTGQVMEARKLLARLDELVRRGSSPQSYAALILIGLGERSKAIELVTDAARTRKYGTLQGFLISVGGASVGLASTLRNAGAATLLRGAQRRDFHAQLDNARHLQ